MTIPIDLVWKGILQRPWPTPVAFEGNIRYLWTNLGYPSGEPYPGDSPKQVGWGDKLAGGADRNIFIPSESSQKRCVVPRRGDHQADQPGPCDNFPGKGRVKERNGGFPFSPMHEWSVVGWSPMNNHHILFRGVCCCITFLKLFGRAGEGYVFILGCMKEDLFESGTNYLWGAEVDVLIAVAPEGGLN